MALEKKIFGYLPINRGPWVSGTAYYQYNEVMSNGSTFIAKHDIANSTVAPDATYDEQTGVISVIPEAAAADWDLVSYGGNAVEIAQRIAEKANIADLQNEDDPLEVALALEAENLKGNSHAYSESNDQFLCRTTAGSLDVDSDEPARLLKLEGMLDDECHPFKPTSFHWSGFNLLNPNQKLSNADISGSSITSGSSSIYYFRVPVLTWGIYGSNDQNNGILFTDNEGGKVTPSGIAFLTELPAIGKSGYAPLSITTHNHTYYYNPTGITSIGYIAVKLPTGIDPANVCAHIAWDNEFDDVYEAYEAGSSIDFTWFWNDSRMHSWGMAGIVNGAYIVTDEIVFDEDTPSNRRLYRRVSRAHLVDLNWTMETGESANTFSADIGTSMMSNGLIKLPLSLGDYTLNGTTISFSSQQASVADFKANVLGDAYGYFQLALPAEVAHSISGQGMSNDMGIEDFLGTDYPTAKAYLSYVISLKYYLESLPNILDNDFDAVVNYLARLDGEIQSLQQRIGKLGNATAVRIDFENLPSLSGYDCFLFGTAAPTNAPNFVGQIYIDTTNKIAYVACGMTAADWKRISNA